MGGVALLQACVCMKLRLQTKSGKFPLTDGVHSTDKDGCLEVEEAALYVAREEDDRVLFMMEGGL